MIKGGGGRERKTLPFNGTRLLKTRNLDRMRAHHYQTQGDLPSWQLHEEYDNISVRHSEKFACIKINYRTRNEQNLHFFVTNKKLKFLFFFFALKYLGHAKLLEKRDNHGFHGDIVHLLCPRANIDKCQ